MMDDFPHFAKYLEQMNEEPPRRSFWQSDLCFLILVPLTCAAVWLVMELAAGGNIASILEAAQ